jgi:hypothetical protein
MKRSTIATTALALAASVFAGSAIADSKVITPVNEDFSTLTIPGSNTNLTWAKVGTDNESAVADEMLKLDTGSDGLVRATIDVANDLNAALADNETVTFSANVSFFPASSTPPIDEGSDLKFALYALATAGSNVTNLMAYAVNGSGDATELDTTIDITSTAATLVTVTMSNGTFKVTVGGTTSPTFNFAHGTNVSKVEFQGNGSVDNITLAYTSTLDDTKDITIKPNEGSGTKPHDLTATEADYLNNLVAKEGKAAVVDKLSTITEETFEKASLLNLDVMDSGVEAAIAGTTFKITSIKRSGTQVTVSVALESTGTHLGNVNGTVALYASNSPTTGYQYKGSFTPSVNEDTDEHVFNGVTESFFQVKIVDPSVIQ